MGHTYSRLLVHVVFSTKDRKPTIVEDIRPRLYDYMAGVARSEFGQAVRIGGIEDHVHGLLALKTDVSVAEAVRKWKSLSSGWVHKTFAEHGAFAWQVGYAAFSVSQSSVERVTQYIENQAEHHRSQSFEDEFRALLKRHGVEHDPQQVWD